MVKIEPSTEGDNDVVDVRKLRDEVLAHSWQNLGYADTFEFNGPCGRRVDVLQVGGGCLIWPRDADRVDELHVLAHGGIECPVELTPLLSILDESQLAEIIWQNYDAGTPSLAAELVKRLSYPGRVTRMIAFFRVSRALVDANRTEFREQVPSKIYRGNLPLRKELCFRKRESIVRELVAPWLEKAKYAIRRYRIPAVFHHHTYDEHPNPEYDAEHVVDGDGARPTAMLFQDPPVTSSKQPLDEPPVQLLESELLSDLVDVLRSNLAGLTDRVEVTVDRPYTLPRMPLIPSVSRQGVLRRRPFLAIVYEVRKDLFASPLNVPHLVDAVDHMSAVTQQFVAFNDMKHGCR